LYMARWSSALTSKLLLEVFGGYVMNHINFAREPG
jgi:hypothetical protein